VEKLQIAVLVLFAVSTGHAWARGGGHSGSHSYGGFTRQYSCPACNTHDHSVSGYIRKNGTYVAPHMQSNSNGTTGDNFSHIGNVNPYTGKPGTKY